MRPLARAVPAVVLAVLVHASAAHADPPPPAEPRSYASATLVVDAASVATSAAGFVLATRDSPAGGIGLVGVAGFALGTPIVHALHGSLGTAAGSFTMRVLAVPTAALVGAFVGSSACPASTATEPGTSILHGLDCLLVGGAVGGLVGMVGVAAIDAAFLAKEPAPRGNVPRVTAAVDPVKRSATLGIGGTF